MAEKPMQNPDACIGQLHRSDGPMHPRCTPMHTVKKHLYVKGLSGIASMGVRCKTLSPARLRRRPYL